MRTFRLFGMTLLMVLCAVSFTACSDDEDETVIEQANLIGKWQSTWEKIHKVEDGKEVVTSDEAYISYDDGYSDVLTVNELTATKLVLAFEDWDNTDDGGLELDDITTTTYKKIN